MDMSKYGSSYSNWVILGLHLTKPYYEVAITGDDFEKRMIELNNYYIPNKLLIGAKKESNLALLEDKFLSETKIFVCIKGLCKHTTTSISGALNQMSY